jgi:hypothetical protein
MGFLLYTPGSGCFAPAGVPFPGAVEGRVKDGRVNFEMNGEHDQFATAAPITRADTLGTRFAFKLKPSALARDLLDDQDSFGAVRLSAASSPTRYEYQKENRSKNRPLQPDFSNTISD